MLFTFDFYVAGYESIPLVMCVWGGEGGRRRRKGRASRRELRYVPADVEVWQNLGQEKGYAGYRLGS